MHSQNLTKIVQEPKEEIGGLDAILHHKELAKRKRRSVEALIISVDPKLLFKEFVKRFPNGIDYQEGREKIEDKNYLKMEHDGKECYVTCVICNKNMDSMHLQINVFMKMDFFNNRSRIIQIYSEGGIQDRISKYGEKTDMHHLQLIDVQIFLKKFLRKILCY